jgi:V8-like Glu-specific endopeptidase
MEWSLYDDEIDFGDKDLKIMNSSSAKDFPHDCVGVIYGDYSKKLVVGTGFLIGSDLVLTVAHNLSSKCDKVEFQNLVFYPGVSGSLLPENAYKVASHRYPHQYAAAASKE